MPPLVEKEADPYLYRPQPADVVSPEIIAKYIAPRVERIRKRYFGKNEPPFASEKEAIECLKAEINRYRLKSLMIVPHGIKGDEYSKEEILEIVGQLKIPEIKLKYFYFDVIEGKECFSTGSLRISLKHPRLFTFAKEVKRLVEDYGLDEAQTLMHVLTGRTYLPPFVRIIFREHPLPVSLIVYDARRLSMETIGDILRLVLKETGIKGKIADERDLEVYRFVQRGFKRFSGNKTFVLKKLQEEWNRNHPDRQFRDKEGFRGLKAAYERACKRLGVFPPLKKTKTKNKGI